MSAEGVQLNSSEAFPGPLPLMGHEPFWSLFTRALNKNEKFSQLERALKLFIQVLKKHESDPILKAQKVEEAENLLDKVVEAKKDHIDGLSTKNPAEYRNIYRKNIESYKTSTASELLAFENEFKALWAGPEGTGGSFSTSHGANAACSKATTPANSLFRRIFGRAMFKTLLTKRELRDPEHSSANPDFDTFETNLHREINESPAARESLQLDRAEPERLAFDPKARHEMQPFEFPLRTTQQDDSTPAIDFEITPSGSEPIWDTSTGGNPSSKADGHRYHHLATLTEQTDISAVSAISVRLIRSDGDSAELHRRQTSEANASIASDVGQAASLISGSSSEMSVEDPNWRSVLDRY